MEGSAKRLKALRELRERLHTETEPDKVYKTLKKLSSVPILCDTLAEIGFRQTIKLLRREQLLVPFAKDLAAKWSERSPLERQAEAEPQDLASQMRLTREQAPRKPAAEDEAHEPAASRARAGDARQVVGAAGGAHRGPRTRTRPVLSRLASTMTTLLLPRHCLWARGRRGNAPGKLRPRVMEPRFLGASLQTATGRVSCLPVAVQSRAPVAKPACPRMARTLLPCSASKKPPLCLQGELENPSLFGSRPWP